MSFNEDGKLDIDEALRVMELVPHQSDGMDLALYVESRGTPVEGEMQRRFEDGKPRMAMLGYHLGVRLQQMQGGGPTGQLRSSRLMVVRQSDAATASLTNLLKSQALDLKVGISIFKAGGDSSPDAQPMLVMDLEEARIMAHTLLSSTSMGMPCEVVEFAYRRLHIRSAAQKGAGARGAVRTCSLG